LRGVAPYTEHRLHLDRRLLICQRSTARGGESGEAGGRHSRASRAGSCRHGRQNRVELRFIQPDKPVENAYIERFHASSATNT